MKLLFDLQKSRYTKKLCEGKNRSKEEVVPRVVVFCKKPLQQLGMEMLTFAQLKNIGEKVYEDYLSQKNNSHCLKSETDVKYDNVQRQCKDSRGTESKMKQNVTSILEKKRITRVNKHNPAARVHQKIAVAVVVVDRILVRMIVAGLEVVAAVQNMMVALVLALHPFPLALMRSQNNLLVLQQQSQNRAEKLMLNKSECKKSKLHLVLVVVCKNLRKVTNQELLELQTQPAASLKVVGLLVQAVVASLEAQLPDSSLTFQKNHSPLEMEWN